MRNDLLLTVQINKLKNELYILLGREEGVITDRIIELSRKLDVLLVQHLSEQIGEGINPRAC